MRYPSARQCDWIQRVIAFSTFAILVGLIGCSSPSARSGAQSGSSQLLAAAHDGDANRVEQLVKRGANVNQRSADGRSALYSCLMLAWGQDREAAGSRIVKTLLDAGADPVAPAISGSAASVLDVEAGVPQSPALELVRKRAEAELVSLETAAVAGKTRATVPAEKPKLLYGDSAIYAAQCDSLVVQLRLARGANPNEKDSDGNSLLHLAIDFKRLDIAKALLDAGADVNLRNSLGNTPLYEACAHDFPEGVSLLLAKGANPYLANNSGETAGAFHLSNAATQLLGKNVLATMADSSRWHFTAPGVEVRLRREQAELPLGAPPALRVDLWNHWKIKYMVLPDPSAATLNVDGHLYKWAGAVANSQPKQFGPAAEDNVYFNDIRLVLAPKDWHRTDNDAPLNLEVGKHTVSATFPATKPDAKPVQFTSSAVSFVVSPD